MDELTSRHRPFPAALVNQENRGLTVLHAAPFTTRRCHPSERPGSGGGRSRTGGVEHRRHVGLFAPTLVAIVLLASCGGGGASEELPSDAAYRLATANLDIVYVCLDGRGAAKVPRAVDTIIKIYRDHPDATYQGHTMRQGLADTASNLDCEPKYQAQLDRELEASN